MIEIIQHFILQNSTILHIYKYFWDTGLHIYTCMHMHTPIHYADCRLQEETPAALHPSYDQWDPCGESKQLQVPRRKHLRGPDLDYTHTNTG